MEKKGFTLIELMIVIAIIAIIAAIAIPGLLNSMRGANERNASGTLKSVATAQVDYRSNDRNGDTINNFWVADLAGLYSLAPDAATPLKLIEEPVARADADAVGAYVQSAAGENTNLVAFTPAVTAKAGYWYETLDTYVDSQGNAGQNYDDGSQHNNSKFGIVAYPDDYGSSGNNVFIISEANTVYKADGTNTNAIGVAMASGAGQNGLTLFDFPNEPLTAGWSPLD